MNIVKTLLVGVSGRVDNLLGWLEKADGIYDIPVIVLENCGGGEKLF